MHYRLSYTEINFHSRRPGNFHGLRATGWKRMRLVRVMHVRTRSSALLSPSAACTFLVQRSHQVHWKVRLTRNFPSSHLPAPLPPPASSSRLPTCLVADLPAEALSLLDATMHIHTHLRSTSLPSSSRPATPRRVSLNSEETRGRSRGHIGTEPDRE